MTRLISGFLAMVLFAVTAPAQNPACSRFDADLEGWTGRFANCRNVNGVVQCDDRSGPSNFVAPPAFLGSWVRAVGGCGQLCFDVDLISSGLSNAVPLRFTITNGTNRASFLTTPLAAGSGPRTFCAPVFRTSTGAPPPSTPGTWNLAPGSDWNALIENVTSMEFAVDYSTGLSERIAFDNICFQATCPVADFGAVSNCEGEPVVFTDLSRLATSWLWTFGGSGVPATTTPSPTVQLPPGTHDVTLCINGGNAAPLCLTRPVTVKRAPRVPAISGATNVCGQSQRLCAPFALKTSYGWTGNDVQIVPDDTRCVTVNATGPSPSVTVTATANGCSSRSTLQLQGCPTSAGECCTDPPFTVLSHDFVDVHLGDTYQATAVLEIPMPYKRITMSLVSASFKFDDPECGGSFPMPVFFSDPQPINAVAPLPGPPFPHEIIWPYAGPATTVSLAATIKGVHQATTGGCNDTVSLCVKYSVTTEAGGGGCRTCDVVRCYTIVR